MTYGHLIALETPTVAPDAKLKRKRSLLPGSNSHFGHSKVTDEQVVDAIVACLLGEPVCMVAERLGVSGHAVAQWHQGISRRKCGIRAEKKYRAMMRIQQGE